MAHDSTLRREFLKAACGAALTSSRFAPPSTNRKVNLAFIGVGRMGSRNLEYAARVSGFRIAAICDLCPLARESAQAQARRLGFSGVIARRDFRDVLADPSVDAVCIATPDHWRPYITVEACKAGKDVYVEKPVFVYIDEGSKMVEAARKYRRVVQSGAVERSGVFFQKAREIVKSGGLGEIAFCRIVHSGDWDLWRGLDIVHFAFDEAMPTSIAAQTFHYPGFIVSYESRCNTTGATSFQGANATLIVNRAGCGIFPQSGDPRAVSVTATGVPHMGVAHWKNFLECIETRAKPVGDIEACVRTDAACGMIRPRNNPNTILDWDDQAFTVRQSDMKQYLKPPYLKQPWKLEI